MGAGLGLSILGSLWHRTYLFQFDRELLLYRRPLTLVLGQHPQRPNYPCPVLFFDAIWRNHSLEFCLNKIKLVQLPSRPIFCRKFRIGKCSKCSLCSGNGRKFGPKAKATDVRMSRENRT